MRPELLKLSHKIMVRETVLYPQDLVDETTMDNFYSLSCNHKHKETIGKPLRYF